MIQILFAKPSQRPSKLPKTASLPNIHQYRDAARIFANGTQDLQVQSSVGFSEPAHQAKLHIPSTIKGFKLFDNIIVPFYYWADCSKVF